MDANIVHQHIEAVAHHVAHAEAHQRARERGNAAVPSEWAKHIDLGNRHIEAAENHAKKAGLRRSFVAESKHRHGELRDHDLPNVEHRKFAPHQHDHLIDGSIPKPASSEYKFELGKHHPMNGKPVEHAALPTGAKIGTKQNHLEGLEHHAQHSSLLHRKAALTANPEKAKQLREDATKHEKRAVAHGAHVGMEFPAVHALIDNKKVQDHELASAPDKFTGHPHDDKLNIEIHQAAYEHHRDHTWHHHANYEAHPKGFDLFERHRAARQAHAKMLGNPHPDDRYDAKPLGSSPGGSFKHHYADVLVHPAHHWDGDKGQTHAIAHHVRYAAGHLEAAEKQSQPHVQAFHANHAAEHERKAVAHGKDLGLKSDDVKQRIGWAKQRGAGVPVVHGVDFAGHPADHQLRLPVATRKEPDHQGGMDHHIDHMLAHHDRALHPEVENDPLIHAHHVNQAQFHREMAFKHAKGEGFHPHEVEQKINEAAQASHRVSVPKDSYAVPHEDDKHAHDLHVHDRGMTKRISREFLHMRHSKAISTGHINHQDAGFQAGDTEHAFSHGTKLADHPVYGSVRLKPAHDIFHEKEKGEFHIGESPKANSSAHREVLFHDLMHNHFGLGEHQHHVGMAHHEGNLYSVHENLKDHVNLQDYHREAFNNHHIPEAHHALRPHFESGKLHQLAAVDYITGNWDRHSRNIMLHRSGGSGKPVQLIDHGLAFPGGEKAHNKHPDDVKFPSHLSPFTHEPATQQHPKLREFVNNLDETKIHDHIVSRGFGKDVAANVHARIMNAKALVNQHDDATHAVRAMFHHKIGYQPSEKSLAQLKTPAAASDAGTKKNVA